MSYQHELKQSNEDWTNYLTVAETVIYGAIAFPLGVFYGVFASATAFMLSKKTNILFKIEQDLKSRPEHVSEYRKASLAIKLRLFVAGFSLAIAFASIYVLHKAHILDTNPAILAATQQIETAQNNLQIGQASLQFTEGEHLAAQGNVARLRASIETEKVRLKEALHTEISAWKKKKQSFWSAKNIHATSLNNDQVMLDNCAPKKSPYGGGFLKTAASKACEQWETIKAEMPNVGSSPEIDQLNKKLREQHSIITELKKIKRLKNAVVQALQNKADLINQLNDGKNYESGFALIVGFINAFVDNVTNDIVLGILVFSIVIVILLTISLTAAAHKINEDYGPAIINGNSRYVYDEPETTTISWYARLWHWFTGRKNRKPKQEKPVEKPVEKPEYQGWSPQSFSLTFSDSDNLKPSSGDGSESNIGLTPVIEQPLVVSNKNDPDFEKATALLKTGKLTPTQYDLKKWAKNNKVKLAVAKMKEWILIWASQGLIEPAVAQNGKQTYRLKKSHLSFGNEWGSIS